MPCQRTTGAMRHRRPSTIRAAVAKGDVGSRSRQPFSRLPFLMLPLAWDRRSALPWRQRCLPIANLCDRRRRAHRRRTVDGPAAGLCRIASTSTEREHLAVPDAASGLSFPRRHVSDQALWLSAEVAETLAVVFLPEVPPASGRSRLRRERPLAPDNDPGSSGGAAGGSRLRRGTPMPAIARHAGKRVATTPQCERGGN